MTDDNVTIRTDDGPMDTFVALPDGAERGPALVLFQEAFGVNAHIRDVARRLAREGFVVLAPELFHRAGRGVELAYGDMSKVLPYMGALDNGMIERDLRATLEHARAHPRVDPARVGSIGFCMGGFAAFLAACRSDVAATVAFYGGGLVRGRPNLGLKPLVDEIPKIQAPILLVFGGADQSIPPGDVEALRSSLERNGKKFEVVVYPAAGHAFFCNERPSYSPDAAAAAWPKTIAFLRAHLGAPGS
jgi:carboxymethylenebutenolidase